MYFYAVWCKVIYLYTNQKIVTHHNTLLKNTYIKNHFYVIQFHMYTIIIHNLINKFTNKSLSKYASCIYLYKQSTKTNI